METFFYYSGIVAWIIISLCIIGFLIMLIVASSIPNEIDDFNNQ